MAIPGELLFKIAIGFGKNQLPEQIRKVRGNLGVLRLYIFTAFAVLGLYLPFFPSWLKAHGFVGWKMSVLVALLPMCQLAAPSIVGILADQRGLRGRMITVCAACTACGLTGLACAAWLTPHIPFVVAFVSMLVFAALRSPSVGLADVLAMEIAPNYGRVRLWGSLGFLTMAVAGGALVQVEHDYQLPMLLSAGLWLLTLLSLLLPRSSTMPPRPALQDAKELLQQKGYRQLLGTMMLVFASTSAYDLTATMHLKDLNASGALIGSFWGIATCSEVLLMFFAGALVERMGPGKCLTFALLVSVARWLFLASASSLVLIVALQPLHAITFGLMWISAISVLKRELGNKGTATAHGLFSTSNAVGGSLGLLSWGVVYDAAGARVVFYGAAALVLLGALSATRLIRLSPARPVRSSVIAD